MVALYLDHHLSRHVKLLVPAAGHQATRARTVALAHAEDPEQLTYAAGQGWTPHR